MTEPEWDPSLAIGVEEIDEQHRTFLRMAADLHRALVSAPFPEFIQRRMQTVEGLQHYVDTHFATEEAYMARVRYPGLAAHRKQHEAFAARVRGFSAELARGGAVLGSELMHEMILWFRNHIADEDQKIRKG